MLHRESAPSANWAADYGDLTGPVLGSAVDAHDKCLGAHAWFDSGCTFCVSLRRALWNISHIFYVKVELCILRLILVSSCKHGRRGSGRFRRLHGGGMHSAGFAGEIALRAVFPTIAAMTACTRSEVCCFGCSFTWKF